MRQHHGATGAYGKIHWTPVGQARKSTSVNAALLAEAGGGTLPLTTNLKPEHPTIAFLRTTDLPLPDSKPGDPPLTAKDWAIFLLHAAAEVEHQFIVQYLYAGFCGNAMNAVVAANRRTLTEIAVEEMGHLLIVQNLLLMLNVAPYLERLSAPLGAVEPFPVSLQPFRLSFIARFLVAESPADPVPPLDQTTVEGDLDSGLTFKTIHRVGAIYAMLDWLLSTESERTAGGSVPDDQHLDLMLNASELIDPATFTSKVNLSGDWSAFGSVLVLPDPADATTPLDTRDNLRLAAKKAIHAVSAQGEGPDADAGALSHFERLRAIYEALKADTSGIAPEGNFATDPLVTGDATANPALITNATTLGLAKTSDALYQILLTCIALSVATSDATFRASMADNAVNEIMRSRFRSAASAVVGKPLSANAGDVRVAGPPFTPPAAFPFRPDAAPSDIETEKALCQRFLTEADALKTQFAIDLTVIATVVQQRLTVLSS